MGRLTLYARRSVPLRANPSRRYSAPVGAWGVCGRLVAPPRGTQGSRPDLVFVFAEGGNGRSRTTAVMMLCGIVLIIGLLAIGIIRVITRSDS